MREKEKGSKSKANELRESKRDEGNESVKCLR